jgi:hypothetical protein
MIAAITAKPKPFARHDRLHLSFAVAAGLLCALAIGKTLPAAIQPRWSSCTGESRTQR